MMEHLDIRLAEKLLSVRVTDQLTKNNYETLAALVKQQVRQHGKIGVVMQLQTFGRWVDEEMWEQVDFDPRHWAGVERLALVGERKWALAMAVLCRSLTSATIRHFDHESLEAAMDWAAAT
jgi:hypothetical protein